MVRRRHESQVESWPLWLREFNSHDWPGGDDVERAWSWREAAFAFIGSHPLVRVDSVAVINRVRAVREVRRVQNESGESLASWRAARADAQQHGLPAWEREIPRGHESKEAHHG